MSITKNRQLANMITMTRIFGVAYIFWFTPYVSAAVQSWVILIYTVICLTDFLDGWIARRLNIVSDVGKILDPLADKILVLVFLPLLEMQVITAFPVFIILAREFAIMALRIVSAKKGTIIPATIAGKIKTAITLPICGILLGRVPISSKGDLPILLKPINYLCELVTSWPVIYINILIWIMVLVTVWSFLDYFGSFIWTQNLNKAGGDKAKAKKLVYFW